MPDLVKLANGPETAPEAVENPEDLAKAKALVSSLNNGSVYWHGFTKTGEPVLWVRCNRYVYNTIYISLIGKGTKTLFFPS